MKAKNNIQQIKNLLLILAMSSLVVACGSSSKQGTKEPIKNETNKTTQKTGKTGKAVFSSKGSQKYGVIIADTKKHKIKADLDKNLLIVDGKKIPLKNNPSIVDKAGGEQAGMAMHYDFKNHKTLFIATGANPTADMPKGSAKYKGEAIDYAKSAQAKKSIRLPASFDVDFDKKTLKGTIGADAHGNIKVKAGIKGNVFSGKHDFNVAPTATISAKGSTYVKGQFYGKGAGEMSGAYSREGIYTHDKAKVSLDTHGVFHAAKQ